MTAKEVQSEGAAGTRWLAVGIVMLLASACLPGRQAPGELRPTEGAQGATAPASQGSDFRLVAYQGETLLGGREVALSEVLRDGKPVVLNFWAGQCPPCRAEMPDFQRVADAFEGRVIFLGIDIGPFTGLGSHEDAQRLLQESGVRYPTAYATDATPIDLYRVNAMPSTIFLKPNGEVESRRLGKVSESELRNGVERLIGL